MIKMFASDLDGTLLNALHEADGTIRRAIRELTEAGLHVVPATGRSTLPIGEHGFTGLALDACCSNGSIVRDSHGEVLKTWTIDPQDYRGAAQGVPGHLLRLLHARWHVLERFVRDAPGGF